MLRKNPRTANILFTPRRKPEITYPSFFTFIPMGKMILKYARSQEHISLAKCDGTVYLRVRY